MSCQVVLFAALYAAYVFTLCFVLVLLCCRDFFRVSLTRRSHRRRAAKHTVRDIMSHPVIAFDAHEPIELCAQMMQEKGIRRAAVRDTAVTAAAAAAESADAAPHQHLAAYVGLVSDASIFRRLGLYPEEGTALEDEDHGLLGLPMGLRHHHGLGAESSADGSGLDTPCSSSRACTPLTGARSLVAPDGAAGGRQPSAMAAATGAVQQQAAFGSACSTPTRQQQQQAQLLSLPDRVSTREGLQQGSSSSGSMGSSSSAAVAAAATAGQVAVCGDDSSSGSKPVAAVPAAGEDSMSASSSGAPDVLSRYKTAAALWEVDMSEMEMIKRIGEGSFGEVMVANYRGTKVRCLLDQCSSVVLVQLCGVEGVYCTQTVLSSRGLVVCCEPKPWRCYVNCRLHLLCFCIDLSMCCRMCVCVCRWP
jgi:hypothetical protein